MKLHLAESDPQHHALPQRGVDKEQMKLRILLSYHYYKDTDLDGLFGKYFTQPYPDVFADSGGFSAMTQGVEIKWQEYAQWVKRYSHLLTVYANLDEIGNAEATLANQKRLEDAGLNPLPVFHTGEDWQYLERYIEQYPYIALGGMVPHMRAADKLMPWIIKAFKMAKGKAVFHGFGATSWEVMSQLPWYSVDSSSWGQGFRFGIIPLFDERKGKFVKVKLGDGKAWAQHASLVRTLGFSPSDFADRSKNDRAKICAISALSYMKAEQWLRGRWGEIHIPDKQGVSSGLKTHLVTSDAKSIESRGFNTSIRALGEAGFGNIDTNEDASSGLKMHLVTTNPRADGDSERPASIPALARAGLHQPSEPGVGVRLHLADTSNGINLGDADKGIKVHLADARGHSGGDLASAASGLKLHQTASVPSQQTEWRSWSATQENGVNVYLVDSPHTPLRDSAAAQGGLKLHLAEHSLDRGGGRGYE